MTAPATGRTADENEMREGIAKTIYEAFPIYCNNPSPKCAIWPWHVPPSANSHAPYYAVADALLSGPLAPILQEAATARKERDEARGYANRNGNAARYWEWIHGEKDKRLARAEQEAATLRARLQEAEKTLEALGGVPSEPGSQASPEAAPHLRPAGVDPSPEDPPDWELELRWFYACGTAPDEYKPLLQDLWRAYCDMELRAQAAESRALGIEARQGRDEGSACESPTPQGGMPEPLATPVPQIQVAGDDL